MRNSYLHSLIFIFFIFLFVPSLKAQEELPFLDPDTTISMDFQDANLKDILKIFSIQSGLNFIASESVQNRTVTLFLDKVPIKEAMDKFFEANNLSYKFDEKSKIVTVLDWGTPDVMTITKVFTLKYVPVTNSSLLEVERSMYVGGGGGGAGTGATGGSGGNDIVGIIQKLISSHGQVVADIRTNSLIVIDIPSRFPTIEETIAKLDMAVPQILLEVEMLDVNKNLTDKIGIKFGSTPLTLSLLGSSMPTGFPFGSWGKVFYSSENPELRGTLNINSAAAYTAVIDFLKTQTDTKYLARPRLLTLNNQTAEIKISSNEAIGVTSSTSSTEGGGLATSTSAERAETGVVLRVTPQVNMETGEITMFIYPKINEAATDQTTFTFGGSSYTFNSPEERSTKTIVRIRDSETVVIGGLLRNRRTEVITKLPLLGDIPFVGNLFTHRDKTRDEDRELLIFITPRIIKENNIALAKAQPTASIPKTTTAVAIPEREQAAIPQDRLNVINNTLGIFDSKNK